MKKRTLKLGLMLTAIGLPLVSAGFFSAHTSANLKPVPDSFHEVLSSSQHLQIMDRNGSRLNTTYQNTWNIHDGVDLHQVPEFLKTAFIISEDKRFYEHNGPDWLARLSAVSSNVRALRAVRGASTITEQSSRMVNIRPRTVWSRWLEGFEARRLEARFSKDEILEFYLNQVPYTANRRGVVQAAQYYFDRDLETLSQKEMLALVVLIRAPSRMDLWKDTERVNDSIDRLTDQLIDQDVLTSVEKKTILAQTLQLSAPSLGVSARDFIGYVKTHPQVSQAGWPFVKTTLNANLQNSVQTLLDNRLKALSRKKVNNGAVLAVDHATGEILVWAVAGQGDENHPGSFYDAVNTPRQPGSALKPILYALALEKGWSAATVINDAPLIESVGHGLHAYQNYSRSFYGPVTLRQALGNSLNIPALKALQYVGADDYLDYLRELGFDGLNRHPNFYGDGIALGNGEVTLFEIVEAFAAMANKGVSVPLTPFQHDFSQSRRVMSAPVASLMGDILSDAKARALEFGEYSVLNFPVQTAAKTGTSSDYRDSWAIGFDARYTVGVWMGNLDQQATDGVTGSTGPALLLRSVFSELNRQQETQSLGIDRRLIKEELCIETRRLPRPDKDCETYSEWFVAGTLPEKQIETEVPLPIRFERPVNNLHIAYDPRLKANAQAFEFHIQGVSDTDRVIWDLNGETFETIGASYVWPLTKGDYRLEATVFRGVEKLASVRPASFFVK